MIKNFKNIAALSILMLTVTACSAFESQEQKKEDNYQSEINKDKNITLSNKILFNKNDEDLSKEGKLILDELISKEIKDNEDNESKSSVVIKIYGNTDNTGTRAFNITLSEQRAKKVAYYLFNNGFPAKQIEYEGHADLFPLTTNENEDGREKNRRVIIKITPY